MNNLHNAKFLFKCTNCSASAKFFCRCCFDFFVCPTHRTFHCSTNTSALEIPIEVNLKQSLKQNLKTHLSDTKNQFTKFQNNYIEIQEFLCKFFDEAFNSFTQTLQALETSIGSLELEGSVSIRDRLLLEAILGANLKDLYTKDIGKFSSRMNELREIVVENKEVKAAAGFMDLKEDCFELWKKAKELVAAKNLDAFNDFVMELEDDLAKVLRKKVEINTCLLKNAEFFKRLAGVCPNIYWIQAKVSPSSLNSLTEILPHYTNLSVLELQIANGTINEAGHQLLSISKLAHLTNLSLCDFDLACLNQSTLQIEFPHLTICKLSKNGGNSALCKFFDFLVNSKKLQYLTITNNDLTDSSMKTFVSSMPHWTHLGYLSISENKLDNNLLNLAYSLHTHNTVREFHLTMNEVESSVVKTLYETLNWKHLNRLVLSFGINPDVLKQLKSSGIQVHLQNHRLLLPV